MTVNLETALMNESYETLSELMQGKGLQRDDVRAIVLPNSRLSAFFGITKADSAATVRQKLHDGLQELISELPDERSRWIAQYSYGVTGDERIDNLILKERRIILDKTHQSCGRSTVMAKTKTINRLLAEDIDNGRGSSVKVAGSDVDDHGLLAEHNLTPPTDEAVDDVATADSDVGTGPASSAASHRPLTLRRTLVSIAVVIGLVGTVTLVVLRNNRGSDTTPLAATLLSLHDGIGGQGFVFPSERRAAAATFLDREGRHGVSTQLVSDALRAGAYLYGGALIEISLEGLDKREISIYNIRPQTTRHDVATDTAIIIEPGGTGPNIGIDYNLDQPHPVAMQQDNLKMPPRSFFEMQSISLAQYHKEALELYFTASRAAYDFTIAIDYEVGGKKYTSIVDNNGTPFRATATLCPRGTVSRPAGVRGHSYRFIRHEGDGYPATTPTYDEYVATCNT